MRLKSALWVKAYVRRCLASGTAAAVVRHGDDDAGAIFIRVNRLDGTSLVFGPAPAGFDDGERDRRWVPCLGGDVAADAEIEKFLERQFDFDSDLWIVEIEARDGAHFLEDWLLEEG